MKAKSIMVIKSRGRLGKKAQVYPIFLVVLTILALTTAYMGLDQAKKVVDALGDEQHIGQRQAQLFNTLQDAEKIKMFVDYSAKLAVQDSLKDISSSCSFTESMESIEDPFTSSCGKYLHPMWSTSESLCLPDCQDSFRQSFNNNLKERINNYYLATGISIPDSYKINIDTFGDYFTISGNTDAGVILRIIKSDQRSLLIDKPSLMSDIESKIDKKIAAIPSESITPKTPTTPGTAGIGETAGISLGWPTDNEVIVSCFGLRRITGGSTDHAGVDIRSYEGDVLAVADGMVIAAGDPTKPDSQIFDSKGRLLDSDSCWGKVDIYHGKGLKSVYVHLQKVYVKPGQNVAKGQKIGQAGGRGRKVSNMITYPSCVNNQYDPHLHLEFQYDGLSTDARTKEYIPTRTTDDSFASKAQKYVKGRNGNSINPLCLIGDLADQKTAPNCGYPFNTDLKTICPVYGLPSAALSAASGSGSLMSGHVTGFDILESRTAASTLGISAESKGTYTVKPAFEVRVNKKIEDPLKPVTNWFEETWKKCDDNLKECLETSMDEFNKKETAGYSLSFASECEPSPVDFFYDIMESFEDCVSNKAYGCSCQFNSTKFSSRQDLFIEFNAKGASISIEEVIDGKTSRKRLAEHEFSFGSIDMQSRPVAEYRLRFNHDKGFLEKASLYTYSLDEKGEKTDERIQYDDYPIIQWTKLEGGDGMNTALMTNIAKEKITPCLYRKDKFRLCAKPIPSLSEALSTIRFSIQFKDQPPKGVCDASAIKVTPANQKPDSDVAKIANIKGFDMAAIMSNIPIPGFQLLGTSISVTDLMSNLPSQREALLNVVVKVDNQDIAGYKVYCNDLAGGISQEAVKSSAPGHFVVIEQNINQASSRLDGYVNSNPYARFLQGIDCDVPTAGADGKVRMATGIRANVDSGKMAFNLKSCGTGSVVMDKVYEKDYCVTLIPVDKNGQEMSDCVISSCAKTNSLFNLALKKLLESQLSSAIIVPAEFLAKQEIPYINFPDAEDFVAVAMGEKKFDYKEMLDTSDLENDLKGAVGSMLASAISKEISGTAFAESIEKLASGDRMEAVKSISMIIKDDDAKKIFDDAVSGKSISTPVQEFIIKKGTEKLDDPAVQSVLKDVASNSGAKEKGFAILKDAIMEDFAESIDKKSIIRELSGSKETSEVKDFVMDKALAKGCRISGYYAFEEALNCLSDKDLVEVHRQALDESDSFTQKKIVALESGKLSREKAKNVAQKLADGSAYGDYAKEAIVSELDKMPDSIKAIILKGTLGSEDMESALRSEIIKGITEMDDSFVTRALKEGNFESKVSDSIRSQVEQAYLDFLQKECKPKK